MPKLKKGQFYLARDKDLNGVYYYEIQKTPMRYVNNHYMPEYVNAFCSKFFEKTTGIKLKPGQQAIVELKIIKIIEEH